MWVKSAYVSDQYMRPPGPLFQWIGFRRFAPPLAVCRIQTSRLHLQAQDF